MVLKILDANPYGPLPEARLQTFEKQLGTALPADYRDYLLRYNGGRPEPSDFWVIEGSDASGIEQFYGLHDGPRWYTLDCYVGAERYGVPEGLLTIGDDGVGNKVCMAYKGDKGAIYFLDHEVHPYHEPNSLEGITKLAGSFSEFLSGLQTIRD